jgi:DNA-binding beta-propeller fold protein YncE
MEGSRLLSALCVFVLLGCQATLLQVKAPLEEEGEVYLYIQPFPQEADRLRFKILEISALSSDGKEFPLSVSLPELKGPDMKRQRLLASGQLPPGSYTGFSFRVKDAILRVEDGEAQLLSPEEPVKMNFLFSIVRKKASLITLSFKYTESIKGEVNFSPVFSFLIPARPITSLVGYVTNYGSNNITVFDKKSGQAVGMIATGRGPAGMALDQMARRAYVALTGEDAIDVIDVAAGNVITRIRLNPGDKPQEIALTPDRKVLLTANTGSNTVSFVDPFTLLEVNRIMVGNGPHSILMDPLRRRAYVFNTLSSTLSILDIANKALITTISTEPSPLRGQFSRKGDRFYIINEWSSYLTAIDPGTLSVLRRFQVRMGESSIKVDTNTDLVYLGRKNDPLVEVYEPVTFVNIDFVKSGPGVAYMTIDGEENNLHIVNTGKKTLMIFNLVSKKIVAEIDVGENPYWATMMGER